MTIVALSIIAVAAGAVWVYLAYRRDLKASRERLRGASRIIETACGPIEYAEAGEGAPILMIHGAGGGFDQGLETGRMLVSQGFRVIGCRASDICERRCPSMLLRPRKRMPMRR
jgi:2-hydroxy-6-oxonona-2,4-dienedioate hydrolase